MYSGSESDYSYIEEASDEEDPLAWSSESDESS